MKLLAISLLASLCCFSVNAELASLGNPNAPQGGEFKMNLDAVPTTLNPLSSTDGYSSDVQELVMDRLAIRNHNTWEYEPMLAKEWKISKDVKSVEITLREGVTWHDGKPFTAEDVKFTIEAIIDPSNKYKTAHLKPYFENVSKIEVISPLKLKVTFNKTYYANVANIFDKEIVPKHIYQNPTKEQEKALNKTLIGTGPYILTEFDRSKNIKLKANPNWWGKKEPNLKGFQNFGSIILRFVQEQTIAIQRMENGDLDFLALSSEDFMQKTKGPKWGKDLLKIKYQNKAPKGYGYVGFNLKDPKFSSVKTRKALAHLLNRELMIKKFLFDMSLPATGPEYLQSDYADQAVKPINYDPKMALKLLTEDGWKQDTDKILFKMINGKKVRLSFTLMNPNKDYEKYLTIWKQDALQAGVEINLKLVEWNAFLKLINEKKFETVILSWGAGDVDWDPKQIWHTDSIANEGSNFVSYSNPKVDKIIDESRGILDRKQRIAKLKEAYRIIAEEVPYIFLFNGKYTMYGVNKRISRPKDNYLYKVGVPFWYIQK